MGGGQRYQAQITAWWCAKILLQTRVVGSSYDLDDSSFAERVNCEKLNEEDIGIELTNSGYIFGQCKRSLNLRLDTKKDWAKTLLQFYRDFEKNSNEANQKRRYVIFYEKPNGNLEKLNSILKKYRSSGTALIEVANSKKEIELIENLNKLLDSLQTEQGLTQLKEKRHDFLRQIYLTQMKFDERERQNIAESLQGNLLKDPNQAGVALKILHDLADDLIAEPIPVDRQFLRSKLKESGVALRDSIDYRSDFDKLTDLTIRQVEHNKHKGLLKVGNHEYIISRSVVEIMLQAVEFKSFLVVGDPGTGKSGCLLELLKKLNDLGQRVIYWSAGDYKYASPEEIGINFQLQYSWENLFEDASSGEGAIIIIDGLDELRDSIALGAYQRLFELAINRNIRVIASVRSFDLQYSIDIKEMFPSSKIPIASAYFKEDFKDINHIFIPELDNNEINHVVEQFPIIKDILSISPKLEPIIRNLFSLDLLCRIVSDDEPEVRFSSISTQADLFEKYWEQRISKHPLRKEIAGVLTKIIEEMVKRQTIQVVSPEMATAIEDVIFSAGIVRYPIQKPGCLPESEKVEFANNLFFDYAAERLFIRPRKNNLVEELSKIDGWGLFLRPSLVLYHRWAWHHGREDFWDKIAGLEKSSVPYIQKLPGYLVVAEEAENREDLQYLLNHLSGNNENDIYYIRILRGIIGAAKFSSLPRLFDHGSGEWWIEFARDLILTENNELIYAGQWLLDTASQKVEHLPAQSKHYLNQAAIKLIGNKWQDPVEINNIKHAMRWICITASSDIQATSEIIKKVIDHEEIKRSGYIIGEELAYHIQYLWRADPNLAVAIYDAFFGYNESDQSPTAINSSQIFSLLSNRKQDYDIACHKLSEEFPKFLSEYPVEATKALIRVIRNFCECSDDSLQKYFPKVAYPIQAFDWAGRECHILPYSGHIWDENWEEPRNDPTKMLRAWQTFLEYLPDIEQHDIIWDKVVEILANENELTSIWRRLLISACNSPRFYSERTWSILLNPIVLAGRDTNDSAKNCIKAFVNYLPDSQIQQIQAAILNIKEQNFSLYKTKEFEKELTLIKAKLLYCIPDVKHNSKSKDLLSAFNPMLLRTRTTELEEIIEKDINSEETRPSPESRVLSWISSFFDDLTAESISKERLQGILRDLNDIGEVTLVFKGQTEDWRYPSIPERIVEGFAKVACSNVELDEHLMNDLYERFREVLNRPVDEQSSQNLVFYDGDHVVPNDLFNERGYAASGFCSLVIKNQSLSPEWEDLLNRIADYPDPAVRFHLGGHLIALLNKRPEFVWNTLERWISELTTRADALAVIHGIITDSWFRWLRENNQTRADQLLRDLWGAAHVCDSKNLRHVCGEWLAAVYLIKGELWAKEVLESALEHLKDYTHEIEGALSFTTGILLPRKPIDPIPEDHRIRSVRILVGVLEKVKKSIDEYEEAMKPASLQEPSQTPEWIKQVAGFFHDVSTEFQFSVKGYSNHWIGFNETVRDQKIALWWETAEPILKALLIFPEPAVVFDIIEGLEYLIDKDTSNVLEWLRKSTAASVPKGLSYERQAEEKTIKILGRVLSEHKVSLASDTKLRLDFIQILDAYMQVGWPEALKMGLQIDSIFR